jgi:hypothetical protein
LLREVAVSERPRSQAKPCRSNSGGVADVDLCRRAFNPAEIVRLRRGPSLKTRPTTD